MLKIPLVIHESDSVAGMTNRILGRYARVITTAFAKSSYPQWANKQVERVGIPIRRIQFEAANKTSMKFDSALPTVLVLGGSSGAHAINDAIVKQLDQLTQNYQLLHVAGTNDYELVKEAVAL